MEFLWKLGAGAVLAISALCVAGIACQVEEPGGGEVKGFGDLKEEKTAKDMKKHMSNCVGDVFLSENTLSGGNDGPINNKLFKNDRGVREYIGQVRLRLGAVEVKNLKERPSGQERPRQGPVEVKNLKERPSGQGVERAQDSETAHQERLKRGDFSDQAPTYHYCRLKITVIPSDSNPNPSTEEFGTGGEGPYEVKALPTLRPPKPIVKPEAN